MVGAMPIVTPVSKTGKRLLKDKILKIDTVNWIDLIPLQSPDFKKYTSEQINKLKTSLQKTGFINPFFIWEHKEKKYLLDGFHRIVAMNQLKDEGVSVPSEVKAIYIDCKNKSEAKKTLLLLNSHYAKINRDSLFDFIDELDLHDLLETVDIPNIDLNYDETEQEDDYLDRLSYENTRQIYPSTNKYGIPDLIPQTIDVTDVIGFNYALTSKQKDKTVHYFLDDYQFSRLWYKTDTYIKVLKKFNGMFSPDFSLFLDYPLSLQIYNVYRNRWIARYMQEQGIKVIPTIAWSSPDSYDFCFAGVPKNNCVAISTVGVMQSEQSQSVFRHGYNEMIKRINPAKIYIYGSEIDGLEGNIQYFEQRRFK